MGNPALEHFLRQAFLARLIGVDQTVVAVPSLDFALVGDLRPKPVEHLVAVRGKALPPIFGRLLIYMMLATLVRHGCRKEDEITVANEIGNEGVGVLGGDMLGYFEA